MFHPIFCPVQSQLMVCLVNLEATLLLETANCVESKLLSCAKMMLEIYSLQGAKMRKRILGDYLSVLLLLSVHCYWLHLCVFGVVFYIKSLAKMMPKGLQRMSVEEESILKHFI